jgi:hypothetical protein
VKYSSHVAAKNPTPDMTHSAIDFHVPISQAPLLATLPLIDRCYSHCRASLRECARPTMGTLVTCLRAA